MEKGLCPLRVFPRGGALQIHRNLKTRSVRVETNGKKVPKVWAPHFISQIELSLSNFSWLCILYMYVLFLGTPTLGTLLSIFLLAVV
jgi:hypothetical protein